MSTQAIYTFVDPESGDEVSVFKHWDNYPEGAALFLNRAKKLAWELPRFEADEFAAAFVAANKTREGDCRLISDTSLTNTLWVDYKYRIGFAHGGLVVEVFERTWDGHYALTDARNLDDMQVLEAA